MQPNHEFIAALVRRLSEDLRSLRESYGFTEGVLREFRLTRGVDDMHDFIDVEFAAWVGARFHLDADAFTCFLDQVLDQHNRLRRELFSIGTPDKYDPNPRAEAHLDRIDMAVNYLAGWLHLKLPDTLREGDGEHFSIRNEKHGPRRQIERALAFAEAARELFATPDPPADE